MIFEPVTEIPGAYKIELVNWSDSRGSLMEIWNSKNFIEQGVWPDFIPVQVNLVKSNQGAIRGIHRTIRYAPQRKIVTCTEGAIKDYLIDLRPESTHYRNVVSVAIDASKPLLLLVPERVGHSYQTISENSTVCYYFDRAYNPEEEIGINPFDQDLRITWDEPYILSPKDSNAPLLNEIALELL